MHADNEGYEGVLLPLLEAQSLIRESKSLMNLLNVAETEVLQRIRQGIHGFDLKNTSHP